jgi:hypothetical protein
VLALLYVLCAVCKLCELAAVVMVELFFVIDVMITFAPNDSRLLTEPARYLPEWWGFASTYANASLTRPSSIAI